jgi:hypothetical protein
VSMQCTPPPHAAASNIQARLHAQRHVKQQVYWGHVAECIPPTVHSSWGTRACAGC